MIRKPTKDMIEIQRIVDDWRLNDNLPTFMSTFTLEKSVNDEFAIQHMLKFIDEVFTYKIFHRNQLYTKGQYKPTEVDTVIFLEHQYKRNELHFHCYSWLEDEDRLNIFDKMISCALFEKMWKEGHVGNWKSSPAQTVIEGSQVEVTIYDPEENGFNYGAAHIGCIIHKSCQRRLGRNCQKGQCPRKGYLFNNAVELIAALPDAIISE
jgi:hypothetical protein